jgi:hypothetical protein
MNTPGRNGVEVCNDRASCTQISYYTAQGHYVLCFPKLSLFRFDTSRLPRVRMNSKFVDFCNLQ